MAKYKLTFKKSVAKDLQKVPKKDVARILQCIDKLAQTPRFVGCKKLKSSEFYRARVGVYRILYEIREDVVVISIIKVGHRSAIYNS